MSINTYLVDTFHIYAASALAANTVLRSILGGVFPLFGLQMYDGLGLGKLPTYLSLTYLSYAASYMLVSNSDSDHADDDDDDADDACRMGQ